MHHKVKELLEKEQVEYRILKHSDFGEIKTVEDFSRLSGIPQNQIAKTLFLKEKKSNHYGMAVLCGSKRADLEEIATMLDFSAVTFGSLDELATMTGYEKFGTTTIGTELPTVIDKALLNEPLIYIASGTAGEELEINPVDLKTITHAKVGNICQN